MMQVKPLPYGLADYGTLVRDECVYVDKTMYIRTLEKAGYHILFLRPRRFGKSLFTSMLGYYYDINQKDNFDFLFSSTDIGRNPTKRKNAYYVLQFDFSGIRADSPEIMEESFTRRVHNSLLRFCKTYHLDIMLEMNSPEIELFELFTQFQIHCNGKIYVIIDEYDHFANELLGAKPDVFEKIVGKDGFVRKWYEVLKLETKTIVERIFITGISPITVDSLTSGFSISTNFSMRSTFNEMIGFTTAEVEQLIKETLPEKDPAELMDTITNYYNGYLFSEDGKMRMFNSNMVLYYLDHYQQEHKAPRALLDRSALSDYGKLAQLMRFKTPEQNIKTLSEVIFNGYTSSELVSRYSLEEHFTQENFKSLLFYLGLLTIKGPDPDPDSSPESFILQVPNEVIKGLYFDFLLKIITEDEKYTPNISKIKDAIRQLAREGSCEKLIILIEAFLRSLSNRDSIAFAEKDLKIVLALYIFMSELYTLKSEYEIERKYIDLAFIPRATMPELDILLFELKYIKQGKLSDPYSQKDIELFDNTLIEAMEQIRKYDSASEFLGKKTTAWAVVFAGTECVRKERVQISKA